MHLDSRDPDRECTLFVDLSQDDYKGEKLRLELGREIGLNLDLAHHAACGYPQNLSLPERVATGWLVGACYGPLVYFWGRVLTRFYAVPESTPVLPTLPILVEEMNATRDFYGFLRRVREAFCERLGSGES